MKQILGKILIIVLQSFEKEAYVGEKIDRINKIKE